MAQSAVNGAGRGGVRRAEKQDRRRKRKAGQRAAAGAVAVAAATTLSFGQTVGAGHAEAGVADDIVNSIVDGAGTVAGADFACCPPEGNRLTTCARNTGRRGRTTDRLGFRYP